MKSKTRKITRIFSPITVRIILSAIVIGIIVRSVFIGNFENMFVCLLVLLLFAVPSFLEKRLRIDFPDTLEIIILCFIFAAEILGEIGSYYISVPYWDTILHTTWGFLCAAIGFSLVDILNRKSTIKFSLSPIFVALVAFCFSMTVGIFWEFFEFAADNILSIDMQKDTVINEFYSTLLDPTKSNIPYPMENISQTIINEVPLNIKGYLDIGLFDTIEDLFVNFIGASVFSIIGYFYIKERGNGKIARGLIPTLAETEEETINEHRK